MLAALKSKSANKTVSTQVVKKKVMGIGALPLDVAQQVIDEIESWKESAGDSEKEESNR